jgi:hypothetical protein
LSYSGNSVLLNLTATLGTIDTSGLNQNQQNVATWLNNFFNASGTLPPAFVNVFGLTGGALGNALTQLDDEAATGAERAVFELTNEFLELMLDPFVNGRANVGGGGGAIGFAPFFGIERLRPARGTVSAASVSEGLKVTLPPCTLAAPLRRQQQGERLQRAASHNPCQCTAVNSGLHTTRPNAHILSWRSKRTVMLVDPPSAPNTCNAGSPDAPTGSRLAVLLQPLQHFLAMAAPPVEVSWLVECAAAGDVRYSTLCGLKSALA